MSHRKETIRKIGGCLLKALGGLIIVATTSLIGLWVGLAALNTWYTGASIKWTSVPLPDNQQADHFVVIEGTYIYVESTTGALFVQLAGASNWEETADFGPDDAPPYAECRVESPEIASTWVNRPTGVVTHALECHYSETAEHLHIFRYVITDGGEIWRWFRATHGLGLPVFTVVYILVGFFGGALVGCILFGVLLLLLRWFARTRE